MADRYRTDLEGVPETLLWNLYQRASEARRPDSVLSDPMAVALVERIDYPFRARFGSGALGQWQALRAACFDGEVRRFLAGHPDGTVVALGDGLETQFWRVDNGRAHWLSVELPETAAVRRRLLPEAAGRQRTVALSALDEAWTAEVDPSRRVLLTAQGLLMYLPPDDVHRLLALCAKHFPGGTLVFDGVPPWFSERTLRGDMRTKEGYVTPPMPWALDGAERQRIIETVPGIAALTDLRVPRGRGVAYGWVFPVLNRLGPVRALGLTGLPVVRADLAARSQLS